LNGTYKPLFDLHSPMSSVANTSARGKGTKQKTKTVAEYSIDSMNLLHTLPRHTIDCTRFRLNSTRKFYEYESDLFRIEIRNLLRGQQVLVQLRSVPRLIYRSNLWSVSDTHDITRAMRTAAKLLRRILGVRLPIWEATVTRMEINRDYFLGERLLEAFSEVLTRTNAARLYRELEPEDSLFPTTVYFRNRGRSRQIMFYFKWAQLEAKCAGLPEFMRAFSKGILRGEIELHGKVLARYARNFQHAEKADRSVKALLIPGFLAFAHERMLAEARLDDEFPEFTNFRRNARRKVARAYPRMAGDTLTRMFDALRDASNYGPVVAKEKHTPRFFRYAKDRLSALGLWRLNFAPHGLPSLGSFPDDNPLPEAEFP
jgi:hypothetical protein